MNGVVAKAVTDRLLWVQELGLQVAAELSEEQLRWPAGTSAPSAGFHLWHLARWTDRLQASLPAMTDALGRQLGEASEIWVKERLAARWGFRAEALGYSETGMGMDVGHGQDPARVVQQLGLGRQGQRDRDVLGSASICSGRKRRWGMCWCATVCT